MVCIYILCKHYELSSKTASRISMKLLQPLALNHYSILTRLHSSRMRTARAFTVSPSMLCAGGVSAPRGCLLPGGVCSRGGVCSPEVSAPRGLSAPRGAVCSGGCLLSRGCLLQGGVCFWGVCLLLRVWRCLLPGGVCSGGGVCSQGVCFQGGVYSWGVSAPKGCLLPGVGIPACTEADTPPVNRMTDACKNITLPQLHCGR